MEERILMMIPHLNEAQKRLFLASEAVAYGRGGIAEVIRITKVSRNTIKRGIRELERVLKMNQTVQFSQIPKEAIQTKLAKTEASLS